MQLSKVEFCLFNYKIKMKYFFFWALLTVIIHSSCRKNDCNSTTVVKIAGACSTWGIQVRSIVYPADSIPDNFKQDGKSFCIQYSLYEDRRLCVCCGGTRALILSIKELPD